MRDICSDEVINAPLGHKMYTLYKSVVRECVYNRYTVRLGDEQCRDKVLNFINIAGVGEKHFSRLDHLHFYNTVDDCINCCNAIPFVTFNFNQTIPNIGRLDRTSQLGTALYRWQWNGIQPIEVEAHSGYVHFSLKGCSFCDNYGNLDNTYVTAEECKAANVIKVVTF